MKVKLFTDPANLSCECGLEQQTIWRQCKMALNIKIIKENLLRLAPLILLVYICISEFHTQFYYWKIFSFNLQFIIIYYWILRDPSILGYGFVFLCGIINDVILSLPLGTSPISYLLVSLVAAYVRNATVRSTLFTDWFTFVVAILGGNMLNYFLIKILQKCKQNTHLFSMTLCLHLY